jgi:hypothetical protein
VRFSQVLFNQVHAMQEFPHHHIKVIGKLLEMEILQVFLLVLQECQPKMWPGERLFASSPPYAIVV